MENLRDSGLADDTIRANGLRTEVRPDQIAGLLNRDPSALCCKGGLVFPYRGLDGRRDNFARVRPHFPRKGKDGKPIKYEQPTGASLRAYFPAGSVEKLRDGKDPAFVTEGEKKALAQDQSGFASIGLGGVYGWKVKDRDELIPDLKLVPWDGRLVYIVFDWDPKEETRRNVRTAAQGLARLLRAAGAVEVHWVELPPGPDGVKQGVDDFLVREGVEAFRELVGQARPVESKGKAGAARETQALSDRLLQLVLAAGVELWHTADSTPFATVRRGNHLENCKVGSQYFRQWLGYEFFQQTGKAVGAQILEDVLNILKGRALFEGPELQTHVRVAEHEGKLYLDLCDRDWRVVEVGPAGWEVISDPPVRFWRPSGALPHTDPEPGGSVDDLRPFVNVTDAQWPLLLAWLVAAYRPGRPFPILKLIGEQGTAKTTTEQVVRKLVDPSKAPVRSAPRTERDLLVAASNGWVLALDNLSHIDGDMSDALCRVASGTALPARKLYTDDQVVLIEAQQPIILNGIEDVGTRSDLQDRSVTLELPRIDPRARRPEAEFWAAFDAAKSKILGALLTAGSVALRRLPEIQAPAGGWPRMADFAMWATAAEPALGLHEGGFLAAYEANRAEAHLVVLECSPVAQSLMNFLGQREWDFEGTATDLLNWLKLTGADTRQKGWPQSPRALSGILQRLAPNLRAVGVGAEHFKRQNEKLWRFTRVGNLSPVSRRGTQDTQSTHRKAVTLEEAVARALPAQAHGTQSTQSTHPEETDPPRRPRPRGKWPGERHGPPESA